MYKIRLFVIACFMYSASVGVTGIRRWIYLQRYKGFHIFLTFMWPCIINVFF